MQSFAEQAGVNRGTLSVIINRNPPRTLSVGDHVQETAWIREVNETFGTVILTKSFGNRKKICWLLLFYDRKWFEIEHLGWPDINMYCCRLRRGGLTLHYLVTRSGWL